MTNNMWKVRLYAILILIVGTVLGFFVYASENGMMPAKLSFLPKTPFALGLDLKGGTHLVYQADVSKIAPGEVSSSMDSLRDVIERRVNIFGVSEPLVQVEKSGLTSASGAERLIVELPGVTDIGAAVAMIGKTPTLEFKLWSDNSKNNNNSDSRVVLNNFPVDTGLTGRLLSHAYLEFNQTTGEPMISLQFNDEGQKLFAQITRVNVGKTLAIFLDGSPITTPVIREEIPNGRAQITGAFTPGEAKTLVRDLNYGALPVPIELVGSQTIGASLGEKAIQQSAQAGIFGFTLVGLFLLFWYRLPGLLAVVSLALYVILNLMLFKLIPVTLTAAGLAGLILSIGMAVDANILIFERMKEELRDGKDLERAVKDGFDRAWPSIRDSNLSSIITATILYWLGGTAIIKGFALVFGMGVVVSMFTAITVSRTLLMSFQFKNPGKFVRFLFSNGLN